MSENDNKDPKPGEGDNPKNGDPKPGAEPDKNTGGSDSPIRSN